MEMISPHNMDADDGSGLPPSFYRALIPNGRRRAPWHDYRSRCIYMITVNKKSGAGAFSTLTGIPGDRQWKPAAKLSPLGEIVASVISSLKQRFPFISILRRCIMPDHVHFVIFVKEKTETHLGEIVLFFKSECSRRAAGATARWGEEDYRDMPSIFESGYHDRILMSSGQLSRMLDYVSDNPRRKLERIINRGFHARFLLRDDEGLEYEAYGNIHLLEDPDILAVRISRKYSNEELRRKKLGWKRCVENGGVLASPFISSSEKRVRDWAMENGGRIIYVRDNGFSGRYSPKEPYHSLCSEGRLLEIAPMEHSLKKISCTRQGCENMNRLAEKIEKGLLRRISK